MRKITSIILFGVQISLLAACSSNNNVKFQLVSFSSATLASNTSEESSSTQVTLPSPETVKPVEVLQTNEYTEGVVIDYEGNIYFSHGKYITILEPDGTNRIWAETGDPNGHKVLADGTHLVANDSKQEILRLDSEGQVLEVVVNQYDGKPLRAPNDLSLDSSGGFYFSDPGGSSLENPIGTVYYVDQNRQIQQVVTGLAFANGVITSPDGKYLYVGESHKNRILVYEILAPGIVGPQQIFAELPVKKGEQIDNQPDGICMDAINNLYVAHYGMGQVQVLNPEGQLIRRYSAGNLTTSNCAFGGQDLEQLFVTGGLKTEDGQGALFQLNIEVPGLDIRPRQQAKLSSVIGQESRNPSISYPQLDTR